MVMVKMHCDGVVAMLRKRGAVGVVCRDDQGYFIGASAVVFEGITNSEVLEAQV
jgi:hypothetical protein